MSTIESLRQYRIFGIAIFDLVAAYLGAFLLQGILVGDDKLFRSSAQLFVAVIPIGVLVHILFNQKTFFNTMVFETKEFNGYKAALIAFLLLTFFA